MAHLLDDLALQVPWKDQDVIRTSSVDFLNRADWYVHSGRIPSVLVWIWVHGEVEKVGSNAAIVKQRVALTRCAVAADSFAVLLGCDEEREQFSLCLLNLFGERTVPFEAPQPQPVPQL